MRRLLRPSDRDGGVAIVGLRSAVRRLSEELRVARDEAVVAKLEAERLRMKLDAVEAEVEVLKGRPAVVP